MQIGKLWKFNFGVIFAIFMIAIFVMVPVYDSIVSKQTLTFPTLSGRIVDNADLLDTDTRQALTDRLAAHESKTTNQIVVVTVPTLQKREIEEYGVALGRAWGVGQKGKDNGVLLIVAPRERKVRIEVGYGLEDVLTDAATSEIIQQTILSRFKQHNMQAGIIDGVEAILADLGDPSVQEVAPEPQPMTSEDEAAIRKLYFPPQPALVTDNWNILNSDERTALETQLASFNELANTNIKLVIVNSLQGQDVQLYTTELAQAWNLSQQSKSALLVIASQPQTLWLETGDNLKDILPAPDTANSLWRNADQKLLVQSVGRVAIASIAALAKLIDVGAYSQAFADDEISDTENDNNAKFLPLLLALPIILYVIVIIILRIRRKRIGKRDGETSASSATSNYSSSSSSDSYSSSSSSGGGGNFGGGGSSGSW